MKKIIDLSMKPKTHHTEREDPPMIVIVIVLAPFAYGLAKMILAG